MVFVLYRYSTVPRLLSTFSPYDRFFEYLSGLLVLPDCPPPMELWSLHRYSKSRNRHANSSNYRFRLPRLTGTMNFLFPTIYVLLTLSLSSGSRFLFYAFLFLVDRSMWSFRFLKFVLCGSFLPGSHVWFRLLSLVYTFLYTFCSTLPTILIFYSTLGACTPDAVPLSWYSGSCHLSWLDLFRSPYLESILLKVSKFCKSLPNTSNLLLPFQYISLVYRWRRRGHSSLRIHVMILLLISYTFRHSVSRRTEY